MPQTPNIADARDEEEEILFGIPPLAVPCLAIDASRAKCTSLGLACHLVPTTCSSAQGLFLPTYPLCTLLIPQNKLQHDQLPEITYSFIVLDLDDADSDHVLFTFQPCLYDHDTQQYIVQDVRGRTRGLRPQQRFALEDIPNWNGYDDCAGGRVAVYISFPASAVPAHAEIFLTVRT